MREEVFSPILGTVNTLRDAAVSCNTKMTSAPVVNKNSFKDYAGWGGKFHTKPPAKACYIFGHDRRGISSSMPHRNQEEMVLPSRPTEMKHLEDLGFHVAAREFRKMQEPKISKLKGGYSSSAGLIFQSRLKDICVHIEDRRLTQREAIQLVKDFTVEHAWDEVEFYISMVAEEDQSFRGLIDHLHDAFQSDKTLSELICDFYGWYQKARETEDTFANDMQVLARKIIVHKPSFRREANQQLKSQYMHKLQDQYYAAMAHSTL